MKILAALLATGVSALSQEPPQVVPPSRTNLLWDYSVTPGVTNYSGLVSNQYGLFMASLGNTNIWRGIMSNRVPNLVQVTAHHVSGTSSTATTNFFVPIVLKYEVYAQTNSLQGFQDWKSLGVILSTNELYFRLRATVTVTN